MNSPIVVEQAKKLVSLPEFEDCTKEESRVKFLYERIYQRPPRPEEIQLGLEFVSQEPSTEKTAADAEVRPVSNDPRRFAGKQSPKQKGMERNRGGGNVKRAPLTTWQEYAHALLQANEASFVN